MKARCESQMRRIRRQTRRPDARVAADQQAAASNASDNDVALLESDPELTHPKERVFTTEVCEVMKDQRKLVPGLTAGEARGMHRACDTVKRCDLELRVTEIEYRVETLTDMRTGRAIRAATEEIGPAGSSLTWRAIAVLMKIVVSFAVPLNRVAQMIGHKSFGSGKIFRVLAQQVRWLVDVYLYLAQQLADASILTGDDTPTRVLAVDEEKRHEAALKVEPKGPSLKPPDNEAAKLSDAEALLAKLDKRFGWIAPKKRGKGDKQTLQVSFLMGRSIAKDPRSTICFYRTHRGQLGDLLTQILARRKPELAVVTLQSDLSSANLPSEELQAKLEIILAGCGAHARRPFWRYRDDDEELCYFLLRGFNLLGYIEKTIDRRARNRHWVTHYRRRAKRIWDAMRDRCRVAVTGEVDNPARYHMLPGDHVIRWPPKTPLYKACMYLINHYEELTRYLEDPRLEYTNNRSERGLRTEVQMLVTSKFRKTRYGRAVLDILRTITTTCNVAEVELAAYIRFVYRHRADVEKAPQKYTPYAFRLRLDAERNEEH